LSRRKEPPSLVRLLRQTVANQKRPVAFVLAGHNGSGKSTLWNERLSEELQIPLINADRLTASILPERDPETQVLPAWAQALRDRNQHWQVISQQGVRAFTGLVMEQRLPFAFETVFSHWEKRSDGTFYSSKIEEIQNMRKAGYFVVLLFVGLVSPRLSFFRVQTRLRTGGHAVARSKIFSRFPRTQAAIGVAATIADMTVMFDNSRGPKDAFSLTRVQRGTDILFDCRDPRYYVNRDLRFIAGIWMRKVVGRWPSKGAAARQPPRLHK
jgi:predicted ABC-type ATPase